MPLSGYREREHQAKLARTTLIDALRACDIGHYDLAFIGAGMAMVFLRPLTNEARVSAEVEALLVRAVERDRPLPATPHKFTIRRDDGGLSCEVCGMPETYRHPCVGPA